MLPSELKPEHFGKYPPQARKLATDNIAVLRSLPLSVLPSFLREAIEYDYKFPAERRSIENELVALQKLTLEQRSDWLGGLSRIQLSASLEKLDWVNQPAQFVEQMSAHLWSTHQQDGYRKAASEYFERIQAATPQKNLAMPRLGITIVGQGVSSSDYPLFRKLRPHGVRYTNVDPASGLDDLLAHVASRAKSHPIPYDHWYIDGGKEAAHDESLVCISYSALEPARNLLLGKMEKQSETPGVGPENLRSVMAALKPSDLRIDKLTDDPVLARFQLKILSEGSGTQIFSTTFAQWAARESLRRAQPLTLLVRFAPRQRQRPMNELLSVSKAAPQLDFVGSLVDGDMGAYYNWINQQRLIGAEHSAFIAWFEEHNEAVAIGPGVPRNTLSATPATLKQIVEWTVN